MAPAPEKQTRGVVRRTERATRIAVALLGAILVALAGMLALFRPGGKLLALSYDIPFLFRAAGSADDIRIVYIDEMDGAFLDRSRQAELLDRLGEAGARAVLYDIIFDRESDDPDTDKRFAGAIRRFRGVDEQGEPVPGLPSRQVFLACGRKLIQQAGIAGEQLIPPNDVLLDAADDFGLVTFMHDDSFTVRELGTGTPDEPSLGWKAALALGAALPVEDRMLPRWLNYLGPPTAPSDPASRPVFRALSMKNVLEGVEPGFFRGKVVIVGGQPGMVGAAAGVDLFSTPYHQFDTLGNLPLLSGVEIQATALANLLHRDWLTRTRGGTELWLIVMTGILLGAGLTRCTPLKGLLVSTALVLLFLAAGILAMHFGKIWFPWTVIALVQIPAAWLWSGASHFYIERFFRLKLNAERLAIRKAFAKYVSPQMLDRLTNEGYDTRLGGSKIMAAVMFTDLESFTEMCVRIRDPEKIVETLNGYFQRTTSSVFETQGIVVKYIGDAIFAAWGAPLADPDAAVHCARAAWKLYQNDNLHVEGYEHRTRIGLHYGEVVAGNIGSEERMDYTLIGDAVNLAARLEGLNKMLGTHILMSGEARDFVTSEFRTRFVGDFIVKGRFEPVRVYEMLGPMFQQNEPTWISAYHEAVSSLKAGRTEDALDRFRRVDALKQPQGDGPSRFFIRLLESAAPIQNGIVKLSEK